MRSSRNISALQDFRRYPPETIGKIVAWQQAIVMDDSAGILVWVKTASADVGVLYAGDGVIGMDCRLYPGVHLFNVCDPEFYMMDEMQMLPFMLSKIASGGDTQ